MIPSSFLYIAMFGTQPYLTASVNYDYNHARTLAALDIEDFNV